MEKTNWSKLRLKVESETHVLIAILFFVFLLALKYVPNIVLLIFWIGAIAGIVLNIAFAFYKFFKFLK